MHGNALHQFEYINDKSGEGNFHVRKSNVSIALYLHKIR